MPDLYSKSNCWIELLCHSHGLDFFFFFLRGVDKN